MSNTQIDIRAERGYDLGVVLDAFLDGDFGDYLDLRKEDGRGSALGISPTTIVRIMAIYAGDLSETEKKKIQSAVEKLTDGAVSIVFSLKDGPSTED